MEIKNHTFEFKLDGGSVPHSDPRIDTALEVISTLRTLIPATEIRVTHTGQDESGIDICILKIELLDGREWKQHMYYGNGSGHNDPTLDFGHIQGNWRISEIIVRTTGVNAGRCPIAELQALWNDFRRTHGITKMVWKSLI